MFNYYQGKPLPTAPHLPPDIPPLRPYTTALSPFAPAPARASLERLSNQVYSPPSPPLQDRDLVPAPLRAQKSLHRLDRAHYTYPGSTDIPVSSPFGNPRIPPPTPTTRPDLSVLSPPPAKEETSRSPAAGQTYYLDPAQVKKKQKQHSKGQLRRWTEEEENDLRDGRRAGKSYKDIARKLGRSAIACRTYLFRQNNSSIESEASARHGPTPSSLKSNDREARRALEVSEPLTKSAQVPNRSRSVGPPISGPTHLKLPAIHFESRPSSPLLPPLPSLREIAPYQTCIRPPSIPNWTQSQSVSLAKRRTLGQSSSRRSSVPLSLDPVPEGSSVYSTPDLSPAQPSPSRSASTDGMEVVIGLDNENKDEFSGLSDTDKCLAGEGLKEMMISKILVVADPEEYYWY